MTSVVRIFAVVAQLAVIFRSDAAAGGNQPPIDVDVVEHGEPHSGRVARRGRIGALVEDDVDAADRRRAKPKRRIRCELRKDIRIAEPGRPRRAGPFVPSKPREPVVAEAECLLRAESEEAPAHVHVNEIRRRTAAEPQPEPRRRSLRVDVDVVNIHGEHTTAGRHDAGIGLGPHLRKAVDVERPERVQLHGHDASAFDAEDLVPEAGRSDVIGIGIEHLQLILGVRRCADVPLLPVVPAHGLVPLVRHDEIYFHTLLVGRPGASLQIRDHDPGGQPRELLGSDGRTT